MTAAPFRFGLSKSAAGSREEFLETARGAEAVGYSTLLVADHLGTLAPWPAVMAAATVTERLRVGPFVINSDFTHPALLAREAATADLLSGGRLELGLGAGHMRSEYHEAGMSFDPGGTRIERLGESVEVVKRLLAGETVSFRGKHHRIEDHTLRPLPPQGAHLPLLIGGNGDRLLTLAARQADIVGFVGFSPRAGGTRPEPTHFSSSGLRNRVELVREAAGRRLESLELNLLVQRVVVTADRRAAASELAASMQQWRPSAADILDSPFLLIGTVDQIVERLRELREAFGVSYFVVFEERSEGFDPVVEALAGT